MGKGTFLFFNFKWGEKRVEGGEREKSFCFGERGKKILFTLPHFLIALFPPPFSGGEISLSSSNPTHIYALRGHPVEPVQVSVMGPPFSGSEHLDACASLTPPAIAALVSPPPPSTADASEAVTRSQVHPLDANCLSCEQQARLGSERWSSALAASIVAQSALAYLAAYVLNESWSPPQGPERSWAPRSEQVMESAAVLEGEREERNRGREEVRTSGKKEITPG